MFCENNCCIYWKNNKCELGQISLDSRGMCIDCIYVDIDEELMEQARTRMKKNFEEQYQEWERLDRERNREW